VFAVLTLAQEKNLVLTGSVSKIRTFCYKDRAPVAWLDLTFQFRNDGDEPLVVIQPNNLLFEKKAYFGTSAHNAPNLTAETLTYNLYKPEDPFSTVVSADDYDPRPGLFRSITSRPSVIEPGAFHEFQSALLIRNGFKFDEELIKRRPASCEEADEPLPQHPILSVEYRLSAKRAPSGNDNFFRDLAAKWKSSGRLVLDPSGDLVYKSQLIILYRN
jgi:hypothetical protein